MIWFDFRESKFSLERHVDALYQMATFETKGAHPSLRHRSLLYFTKWKSNKIKTWPNTWKWLLTKKTEEKLCVRKIFFKMKDDVEIFLILNLVQWLPVVPRKSVGAFLSCGIGTGTEVCGTSGTGTKFRSTVPHDCPVPSLAHPWSRHWDFFSQSCLKLITITKSERDQFNRYFENHAATFD